MSSVGNPTIYGPIQLRIADCLIALAALFGWPIVGGVTLGCLLTNAYYFLGAQDVIFGPAANLIAACAILLLRKHRFFACVVGALPIGIVVGAYLPIFFQPPEVLGFLPAIATMIVSIVLSSLISIAGIGYTLLSIIGRPSIRVIEVTWVESGNLREYGRTSSLAGYVYTTPCACRFW